MYVWIELLGPFRAEISNLALYSQGGALGWFIASLRDEDRRKRRTMIRPERECTQSGDMTA